MRLSRRARPWRRDAGATLYLVAAALVALLGISALAIDLVSFYVVRNEAQRAADAAALAGARVFLDYGCTTPGLTGCDSGGSQEAAATTQATTVAAQNLVGGVAPASANVGVSFSYPNAHEPQITVTVYRDTTHSNPMQTFFGKILGINNVDISASATAEAYNTSTVRCVRPFLVPNCDPVHLSSSLDSKANANCRCSSGSCGAGNDGKYMQYFFYPAVDPPQLVNPGIYNASTGAGVIGEPWQLHQESGPSQWFTIAFNDLQSGSDYEKNIYTCVPTVVGCGSPLNSLNGKKVGPTTSGICTLINVPGGCSSGSGTSYGQDSICSPTTPSPGGSLCPDLPFTIYRGTQPISGESNSVIAVAVYDGNSGPLLAPGGSTVTVSGHMTLFVRDVVRTGTDDYIDTVVTDVSGCGTTGNGVGDLNVPIRLIHQ